MQRCALALACLSKFRSTELDESKTVRNSFMKGGMCSEVDEKNAERTICKLKDRGLTFSQAQMGGSPKLQR